MRALIRQFENFYHLNLTLLDQGVVSGVNFITGILLARLLGLETFGQFSLGWVAVLFVNSLQTALITFPMMSIGPKISEEDKSAYYAGTLAQQLLFAILASLLLTLGVYVSPVIAPDWNLAMLTLPLSFACFSFLMQEFVRRYFFMRHQQKEALINDLISYGGQLLGLLGLLLFTKLDAALVLYIIGITSMLAAIYGWGTMGINLSDNRAFKKTMLRNWEFGSWLTVSNTIHWGGTQGLLMLSGALLGTASVGGIRAVINLTAPVNIILQGLLNIAPVRSSQILADKGHSAMVHYLIKMTGFTLVALGAIFALIVPFKEILMRWLYGSEYMSYTHLVLWQVFYIFAGTLLFPLSVYYRSMEQTRIYTLFLAVAAPSAILVTWLFIPSMQASAVFLGLIVNQLFALVSISIGLWYFNKGAIATNMEAPE